MVKSGEGAILPHLYSFKKSPLETLFLRIHAPGSGLDRGFEVVGVGLLGFEALERR